MSPTSLLGAGFVGSAYARLYPHDTTIEPRDALVPTQPDVLYSISTTDNYRPLNGDLHGDIDTNLTHLMNVLPNVRGSFAFLSSWFTYAGGRPTGRASGARESETGRPMGFYSATKACAEMLLQSYVETARAGLIDGPSGYQILRLSNVIGNDPRAGKQKAALEHMLAKAVRGETVEVYEGDCYRDILHVTDTCRGVRLCLERGEPNAIYNVGRGESHKLEDIIHYAIAQTGSRSRIVRVPVPAFHKVVQVPDFFMDTAKLRALGYAPQLTVWQSIDRVLAGLTSAPAS